ncbi:hypothetical protein BpHYR1_028333 [Brachionus plicatilis]|uniref:Uncharacterized protein n=1 Tax=Brachionus plicatilis TaxID=10195 RepID=A0A3M7R4L4_BRAPC|nr:hypothetical protein BpHYR1_028333 [Brachionus plicatilis]
MKRSVPTERIVGTSLTKFDRKKPHFSQIIIGEVIFVIGFFFKKFSLFSTYITTGSAYKIEYFFKQGSHHYTISFFKI